MNRWACFSICAVGGAVMVMCGLLVPVHLRAVDDAIVQRAGEGTTSLVERGLALLREQKPGAAELLLEAARQESIPGREKLEAAIHDVTALHPDWLKWGVGDPWVAGLFPAAPGLTNGQAEPFTDFVVRLENRGRALEFLAASKQPAVQELMRCRALTNTVLFPPSSSASGQAFDTALAVGGLLLEEGHMSDRMQKGLAAHAWEANQGGSPQSLEQAMLDLMSLGQRLNWGQLVAFVSHLDDVETLRQLAAVTRKAPAALPVVFSAAELTGKPADVARYLQDFSLTGPQDLGASLRHGSGGVEELLRRDLRLYRPGPGSVRSGLLAGAFDLAADFGWRSGWFAFIVKWTCYLGGGFLLAAAAHFARPAVSELDRPLQVRGIHVAREILFALGFLLVVLLLSEPFLAQDTQRADNSFRLRLPTSGAAVTAGTGAAHPTLMQPSSLLPVLLFFVLQGLLYVACLVKLAEIRRQPAVPRMKLKLLENEDHLFDAGLYLGFVGTIICFILASLGMIKLSLMVAYSSTSFGIIFVSIFKIFHLRPARRQLLLEAETEAVRAESTAAGYASVS